MTLLQVDTLSRARTAPLQPAKHARQPLVLPAGAPEAAKWLALLIMTADHVDKYLFDEKLAGVYALGRIAMPLFVLVLAYNLARPGALERGVFKRTFVRMCIAGALATPVFVGLVGWWPLNIMFTLALATGVICLIEAGGKWRLAAAVAAFIVAGAFVEFWWPAIALCVAAWLFCKKPTVLRGAWVVLACASLAVINRNQWALASLPVAFVLSRISVSQISIPVPRARLFFYGYYPAHLVVLWVAARL